MRALVLAHDPGDDAARLGDRLVERGFEIDTHPVTEDVDQPQVFNPFPDPAPYDLVVPLGSIRSLTRTEEIEAWIHTELDLIRHLHRADVPILGICFGGQLLADALGGSVEAAPAPEIGWYEVDPMPEAGSSSHRPGPWLRGPWLEWHHDRFQPPPGAEVLARTEAAVQLIRVGRSIGTQFHPEIDVARLASWFDQASAEYLDEVGVVPESFLAESATKEAGSIARCHHLVDWFLDQVAFPGVLEPGPPIGSATNSPSARSRT